MQLLSTPRPLTRRRTVRLLAALCCAALPVLGAATRPSAASAAATEVLGNATHFDGLGSPYGGCGLPQRELDSQDFVALNVFNTPGDYSGSYPRPVPDSRASIKGVFDNGRNCGRWVKVTIGDYCTGTNDGAPGQAFCRNGSWVADTYEGATLTMLVADSCADSNAWCRDDPNHLDLATDSLNRFRTGTTPVGTMYPDHWNNRHVSWSFVPAPDYSGDIRIGFLRGSSAVLGQSYVIGATASGGSSFTIRIRDAADAWVGGERTYSFSLPSGCAGGCSQDYTAVPYTTGSSGGTPSPTPAPSPSGDAACTAEWKLTSSWQGGYQADVTVTDTGSGPVAGWSVHHTLPGGVTVANLWNAVVDPSRPATTVHNASYNGSLAPGTSTTWGMTLNGDDRDLGTLSCTAS